MASQELSLPMPQHRLQILVEHPLFTRSIIALILINAVTLGLETTSLMRSHGTLLHTLDTLILCVFTLELVLKLICYRSTFFKGGWNWFDLIIVTASWLPASGPLSVMRAFRILRVLRLFSVVPQMRRVIGALGHSLPGMASVVGVLGIIFYVSAVLVTKLFGNHPDANMQEWFGSIGASAYTLFQVMTLESWSMGIVRPTMELFPLSWLFFVPFIIITSFAVLNLFIGIIVDAMQVMHEEEQKDLPQAASKADIDALKKQLDEVLAKLNGK
ncbi:ion transporter [Aliiglaciecola sp. CAU 1673]|uniref:ion transporter n=1 Tax=Aliiglaciecola sp. CAU 1673 TaxID=3032595 RepID=UPI0023DC84AF|nr:ion transporter [Aliiglaciecola sp. CAU 1673]MDF2176745.1 ion transporter [Aliiglaciecola sp. CAU 1673]